MPQPTDRPSRHLTLGALLHGAGTVTEPLWRDPAVPTTASIDVDWYTRQAQEAEAAGLEWIFIVDSQYVDDAFPPHHLNRLEPLTLLAAVAARTTSIGLVATISTTYSEPFDIARRLASLDLISDGRAGWNVVTSQDPGTAGNFSRTAHGSYAARYRRAAESIEVVRALWDSYEPDAFATDRAAERFLDPTKQHRVDHVGEFFRVTGPLNIIGSRQRHPVVFQAGTSDDGRDLSASAADVAFNFAPDVEWGADFAEDVRARTLAAGRDPGLVRIVPALSVVIGDTDEEARERLAARRSLVDLHALLHQLSRAFGGYDFRQHDLDAPFPEVEDVLGGGPRSLHDAAGISRKARERGSTLREVLLSLEVLHIAQFVGTATTVADEIERWFRRGAADGFNLFVECPQDWHRFLEEVVPILRARGLLREQPHGATLRERLGLPLPQHRHVAAREIAARDVA